MRSRMELNTENCLKDHFLTVIATITRESDALVPCSSDERIGMGSYIVSAVITFLSESHWW